MNYQKIPEDEYNKKLFQARGQINGIMNTFRCYGMDSEVDSATPELVQVMENFAMSVRGKEIPILVRNTPRRRPME